jgi:2,3,4,5-tetrahydropyridine-2-carboxylate N-succinyltransferase
MVDTWATVGSCAQIGKNVHLSGGVGIGGVLEPLQAGPTIIEDNCFVGARSEVVEGVVVGEGSVDLHGRLHRRLDQGRRPGTTGEIHIGKVPPYFGRRVRQPAWQAPARTATASPARTLYCAVIVKKVDAQTRSKTSDQRTAARLTHDARRPPARSG